MASGKTTKGQQSPRMQNSANQFKVRPGTAFAVFATVNIIAALTAPISDCDESFNYWEPTHYLSHGYGLQTWEYSPEFAIRSWTYVVIHAIYGQLAYLFFSSKVMEFYWTRCGLALVCAYCETRFVSSICKTLNPRLGIMMMVIMISSPGFFNASISYLPSSFAMYMNMLGACEFIDWRGGSYTPVGILWFGIGGIIGWPFAAALALPFVLQDFAMMWVVREWVETFRRYMLGCTWLLIVLVVQVLVEIFFYHKLVIVPWNIVFYNVFSGSDKGPDIFGTEPASFYIRNLLLNFNIWLIFALAAGPVVLMQYTFQQGRSAYGLARSITFTTPFYLWLGLFTLQNHKEERFMFPAYPFLALNAAITLHSFLGWVGNANPRTIVGRIPALIKFILVISGVLAAITIGFMRTAGNVTAYRAPLRVYDKLAMYSANPASLTLCLGKEWYRFPASYFLPNNVRARFLRSEFRGLLPGEFNEAKVGFGLYPGSWLIPSGMNDRNIEDVSKYTELARCDFLVDSLIYSQLPTTYEPAYINDTETWERIHCEPFLDSGNTHVLGRLAWLPDLSLVPAKFRRNWGEYCLLRRIT